MKKVIALFLAVVLMTATLAGCSGSTATSSGSGSQGAAGSTSTESGDVSNGNNKSGGFKIGINCFGTSSYALLTLANNSKNVFEYYGDDVTVMDDNFQPDKIVQDIENMISSGVDGVAVWLPADSLYSNVAKMCEQNQVPFVLVDKTPMDPALAEEIKANPYFAGAVCPANAIYGEQVADFVISQGWTSCIVSSSAVGDPTDTPRLETFTEKFEAAGGTIKTVLRSDSQDRIQADIEDSLMAYPDVDFVYGTGSDYGNGAVGALDNLGNSTIKIVTSGLDSQAVNALADGKIAMLSGDNWVAGVLSAVILQNWLEGNPLKDADGNVPYIEDLMPFTLTPEQSNLFTKVFIDNFCYTDDELAMMSTKINPDFDYDAFMEVANSFSFEERARAMADAGIISADELSAAGIG